MPAHMPESRQQPRVAAARILLAVAAIAPAVGTGQAVGGGVGTTGSASECGQRAVRSMAVAARRWPDPALRRGAHDVVARRSTLQRRVDGRDLAAFILSSASRTLNRRHRVGSWLREPGQSVAHGRVATPQPWVTRVPWPTKAWSLTPLGPALDEAHQDVRADHSPACPC